MIRLTDLCEYCEKESKLKKQITKFIHTEKFVVRETFDVVQFRKEVFEKALEMKRNADIQTFITEEERLHFENRINDFKIFDSVLNDYEVSL